MFKDSPSEAEDNLGITERSPSCGRALCEGHFLPAALADMGQCMVQFKRSLLIIFPKEKLLKFSISESW